MVTAQYSFGTERSTPLRGWICGATPGWGTTTYSGKVARVRLAREPNIITTIVSGAITIANNPKKHVLNSYI